MQKILITGAAGYIGSTLTYMLLESGYQVVGVDKLMHGIEPLLGALRHHNFSFVQCDITDVDRYAKYIDNETTIVHLAAIVGEPACKKYPEEAIETNYQGTKQIIDLLSQNTPQKFIFATTCSNYGMVPKGHMATEDSDLNPLGLYAQSKVDMEKYLMEEIREEFNWTILRFATVYGIGPRIRFDLTVNEFAAYGYINKELDVYLPHTVRPYVHVYDVARAIRMVIDNAESTRQEVFNVGDTAENYEKEQIVALVKAQVPELQVKYVATGTDLRDYRVDFDKIKSVLGYHIAFHAQDGVKEIINAIANKHIPDVDRPNYRNC